MDSITRLATLIKQLRQRRNRYALKVRASESWLQSMMREKEQPPVDGQKSGTGGT